MALIDSNYKAYIDMTARDKLVEIPTGFISVGITLN